MKTNQIFIGSIKKCIKYEEHPIFSSCMSIGNEPIFEDYFGSITVESEMYKKDAILLKVDNSGYVDIDNLNNLFNYINVYKNINNNGFTLGGLIMTTSPYCEGSLFVDTNDDTFRPYYDKDNKAENVSILKLRKEVKNNRKI